MFAILESKGLTVVDLEPTVELARSRKVDGPNGYGGGTEDGTVQSVERYVGSTGGAEGVKLAQMVQVTHAGVVPLSSYP